MRKTRQNKNKPDLMHQSRARNQREYHGADLAQAISGRRASRFDVTQYSSLVELLEESFAKVADSSGVTYGTVDADERLRDVGNLRKAFFQ